MARSEAPGSQPTPAQHDPAPPEAAAPATGKEGVARWRKSDNDLGARLRLIASSYDELEKARS
jgi:hypothetical protein